MKTVVITGSTRGLGYEMAKVFKKNNYNVVINGVNYERLDKAVISLNELGGQQSIELPEKTKKIYNILGDYPDVVAAFLVEGMMKNEANNAHIEWLTGRKAAFRFMTAAFNKRDFFK